jgi:hypothetical protein
MSNRRVRAILFAGLAAALASPVRAADGVSQTRNVSGFERITMDGAFTADVTAGAGRTRVVVSGDPSVVARVTTENKNGTLVIGMSGDGIVPHTPKITIELPVLRRFANDGAGAIQIRGLTGSDIEIVNSGAASIDAAGRAARETVSLDGIGKIDATAVEAHDVVAKNNGVGSIRVRASGTLSMNVNGVGEIRYAGNPSKVESHVDGIGRTGPL